MKSCAAATRASCEWNLAMPRILSAVVAALAVFPAFAAEVNVPAATGGAELTVYNSHLALVRERRSFQLPAAGAQLAFSGVSGRMMPETALLEVVKGNPVKINEQTFSFNVISPTTLLERSVGKEVTVYLPNAAGRDVPMKARVLSADGPVVEIEGKVHAGFGGRIMYDSLPAGLRSTPTLFMDVVGTAGKPADAEFSYLTGGVMWQADYVIHYDADAARMDLTGWATITNTTGIDFKEAKLKLVAGDVNRVSRPGLPGPLRMMEAKAMAAAAPMADGVNESQLESNHLYTIAKPVTLADKETKQLSLLSGDAVPVVRELVVRNNQIYLYQNQMRGQVQENRAALELAFKNDKASKLGVPLPAGTVRVYGMDDQGASQFIGESTIDHTASGSEVRISLGRDFDVPVTREQTTFVRASETIFVSAWKITLRNAKARAVKVRVIEPMPQSWEISKESHPHTASNASTMEWVLDVPAKGETVLEYNVKSVF
jgi:hypothetical protein